MIVLSAVDSISNSHVVCCGCGTVVNDNLMSVLRKGAEADVPEGIAGGIDQNSAGLSRLVLEFPSVYPVMRTVQAGPCGVVIIDRNDARTVTDR